MILNLKPIYTPIDTASKHWVGNIIDKYLDGRTSAVKDHYDDVITMLSSLLAYQGAQSFNVTRKMLSKEQALAWDAIRKNLMGVILKREAGHNTYSIKKGSIPHDVKVMNNTQRGINYRIEGHGVQWNNLTDIEPSLVTLICGVRAVSVDIECVDLTLEHLLEDKRLPNRFTFNTDLSPIPISDTAVELADSLCTWLNLTFERRGYIMGVKRTDGAISLVCAQDVAPNLTDLLANLTLRWFQIAKLPQVTFPLHIHSNQAEPCFIAGRPLTQLRMELI